MCKVKWQYMQLFTFGPGWTSGELWCVRLQASSRLQSRIQEEMEQLVWEFASKREPWTRIITYSSRMPTSQPRIVFRDLSSEYLCLLKERSVTLSEVVCRAKGWKMCRTDDYLCSGKMNHKTNQKTKCACACPHCLLKHPQRTIWFKSQNNLHSQNQDSVLQQQVILHLRLYYYSLLDWNAHTHTFDWARVFSPPRK